MKKQSCATLLHLIDTIKMGRRPNSDEAAAADRALERIDAQNSVWAKTFHKSGAGWTLCRWASGPQ